MTRTQAQQAVVRKWASANKMNHAHVDASGHLHIIVRSNYMQELPAISLTLNPVKPRARLAALDAKGRKK